MLYWTPQGTVRSRELYHFDPNPREEGSNIAAKEPASADKLQALLLSFLKNVKAETTGDFPGKKPKGKRK